MYRVLSKRQDVKGGIVYGGFKSHIFVPPPPIKNESIRQLLCIMALLINLTLHAQNVGIGTATPDPSARLEIADSARGLLIPRLTQAQRDAIVNPAHGLLIINLTNFCLEIYNADSNRWYSLSCPLQCSVCCEQPANPTAQNATNITTTSFTAVWDSVPNVTQYLLDVATDSLFTTIVNGCNGNPCQNYNVGNITQFNVSGIGCGVTYYYRVRAKNTCGFSGYSNTIAVSLPCITSQQCLAIGGSNQEWFNESSVLLKGGFLIAIGSTSSFGNGGYDGYIAKIAVPSYSLLWAKTIGGTGSDYLDDAFYDNQGNLIIIGIHNSRFYDVWIVSIDSAGNLLYSYGIGGAGDDMGHDLSLFSQNKIILCGHSDSFGAGGWDGYLVMVDNSGNILWSRVYGTPTYDDLLGVVPTKDGNIVAAGFVNWDDALVLKVDSLGNIIWARSIGGPLRDWFYDVTEAPDGSIIAVGYTLSFGAGGEDMYVAKFAPDGTLLWTKTIGGVGNERAWAVLTTTQNEIIVIGYTGSYGAGSLDGYVVKLDSNGNLLWSRTMGGTGEDRFTNGNILPDGTLLLSGSTTSWGQGLRDLFIATLDSSGNGCCVSGSGAVISSGGTIATPTLSVSSGGSRISVGTVNSGGILTRTCP